MQKVLNFWILGPVLVFFAGLLMAGWGIAIICSGGLLIAMQIIRRMPCGKAGVMVFFMSLSMIYLTANRENVGEVGFWTLLLLLLTFLFLAYKRAALDGEGGCNLVCPVDE